ncbi:hypothetical protein CYMTET_49322 [Cymbomonas tetramitiformis]|uniref:Uncharacterized protein n=1 Tax=Cymbomonas tetramitiformis TaxID=36881 RepID=A0AAE0BRR8_9CHLO|nr:hypothetical protein CYMTET_49322 [Cymbomonas tetramitiformis]
MKGTQKPGIRRQTDCWEYVTGYHNGQYVDGDYCCASSESECCKDSEALATGIIVVIVVVVVVVVGAIIGCCFCCASCPGYQRMHPPQPAATNIVMQPTVQMQPGVPVQTAIPAQQYPQPNIVYAPPNQ